MTKRLLLGSACAAALSVQPLWAQDLPTGPGYPTNTTRPAPRPRRPAPPPPPPPPQQQQAPTQTLSPTELPPPDVQLSLGWITQEQYDALEAQARRELTPVMNRMQRDASDARRAQAQISDRTLDALASFGTNNPDTAALLAQMGYAPQPGDDPGATRRRVEAAVSIIQGTIRTEQNAGNIIRPATQDAVAASTRLAAANLQALQQTGRAPAAILQRYEREAADLNNRVVARVNRVFYEQDERVRQAARILDERRDQIVDQTVAMIERNVQRYGPDPRAWPQPTPRQPPPTQFSYTGVLEDIVNPSSRTTTPAPAPRSNPRNLPGLAGPDRRQPAPPQPVPAIEDISPPDPDPVPQATPGRVPAPTPRPVRRGTIPSADPEADFRVREEPAPSPTPQRARTPQRPPNPAPRQQQRPLPDPVVLTEVRRDDELGRPANGTAQAPSMIDQILARAPRLRDGSIDWARIPLAIRAQVILAEARARRGAGGYGGSGGGGDDSIAAAARAELARLDNERERLARAAEARANRDANWDAMVDGRFDSNRMWEEFRRNGGTLTTLQLEDIYRNYDLQRGTAIPPAMSLSSAPNSLSAVGRSLSAAGTPVRSGTDDYNDPAVQSLYEALYGLTQRRGPYAPREAEIQTANLGDFDLYTDPTGRWGQESGGYIAASLFSEELDYLQRSFVNGRNGLQGLLAQPFNVLLTWGTGAFDLDLHMTGPTGTGSTDRFHIYYVATGNLQAFPFAQLIRDCVCSAGSEVILTSNLLGGGVYRVSVFNFGDQAANSNNLSNQSNARIQIVRGGVAVPQGNGTTIQGGRLILDTVVPVGQPGNTWVAVELDPRTGRITVPRTIRQSEGSANVR